MRPSRGPRVQTRRPVDDGRQQWRSVSLPPRRRRRLTAGRPVSQAVVAARVSTVHPSRAFVPTCCPIQGRAACASCCCCCVFSCSVPSRTVCTYCWRLVCRSMVMLICYGKGQRGDERKGGSIVELKGEARPVERSLSCAAHGVLLVVAPILISL